VYDMYHWDQSDQPARGGTVRPASRAGRAATAAAVPAGGGPAAHAVQVALDRRDNGGDPGATSDQ
jgi:hypothetical protein